MDFAEALEVHMRAVLRTRVAAIERACEAAVQGGEHGVLVNEAEGWAAVHVSVPYGEVHYLPAPPA